MTDGTLITAAATVPLEFAYEIFKRLAVYPAPVLEGWYGMFKAGAAI